MLFGANQCKRIRFLYEFAYTLDAPFALAAIAAGARSLRELRTRIYPTLDARLHRAAEIQLTAHLIKLREEGYVRDWPADIVMTEAIKQRVVEQKLAHAGCDLLGQRSFRKRRGYAAAVALTLALGVGASTSIFAFVDAALLQPPPFPEPARLGVIWGVAGPERDIRGASYLEIQDWKARTRAFDDVVVYDEISLNLSIDGAEAARAGSSQASITQVAIGAAALVPVADRLLKFPIAA